MSAEQDEAAVEFRGRLLMLLDLAVERARLDLRAALTTTPTPAAEVGRREESGR